MLPFHYAPVRHHFPSNIIRGSNTEKLILQCVVTSNSSHSVSCAFTYQIEIKHGYIKSVNVHSGIETVEMKEAIQFGLVK